MVAKFLEHPTLVLNRQWQPVSVATVARSLVLLWNESARVVDPEDYRLYTWADWSALRPRSDENFIQAVQFRLRVPEVIVLNEYDRLPTAAVIVRKPPTLPEYKPRYLIIQRQVVPVARCFDSLMSNTSSLRKSLFTRNFL